MLYGELGRFPISINIKSRMISFWNRLICSTNDKLSKQIYNFILNDTGHEYKWLSYIATIFNNTGNGIIWLSQNQNKVKNIHKIIEQSLKDQFVQEWSNLSSLSNKAKNYRLYKSNPGFESYLTKLPESLAVNMFLFRTSNHKLPVETGRWHGTVHPERICQELKIGDEMHYLLSCPAFSSPHSYFLGQQYCTKNTYTFSKLMK